MSRIAIHPLPSSMSLPERKHKSSVSAAVDMTINNRMGAQE
jgi:hypothetical protein